MAAWRDLFRVFGVALPSGWTRSLLHAATGNGEQNSKGEGQTKDHLSFSFQNAICSRTRFGAVPPKLMREATEASRLRTVEDILGDCRLDRLHFAQRQLVEIELHLFGAFDDGACDVMGLPERFFQHAHQPIGQIGRGRIARRLPQRASPRDRPSNPRSSRPWRPAKVSSVSAASKTRSLSSCRSLP